MLRPGPGGEGGVVTWSRGGGEGGVVRGDGEGGFVTWSLHPPPPELDTQMPVKT